MTDTNWRLNGTCREVDPELFFPKPTDRKGTLDAMAVCVTCPVKAQCRQWAQDTRQEYGVWGGKDFQNRKPVTQSEAKERKRERLERIRVWTDQGRTAKEIGEELNISARMVERYKMELRGSSGGKSTEELIAEAAARTKLVAELTAQGWSAPEIAAKLGVHTDTIHTHRRRARKLSLSA